ncbi:extracellular solute-binding protein [Primorskyibacter flagellatus]|uniref:Carbohydrate ABC transporter substrate-binding protein, CUT1 family n=1 Tax=Primorskyibacter flagellatus TaxID=1387277 RepID=A0A1W2EB42_9RHOB|nr:extracellular solute-binding protein [Primorskyibacter flagellatus]SMD06632.1 carbohydrate ABC transporter substrate-binding protein, CUT1 family [Primorskyibacter flagellatus]
MTRSEILAILEFLETSRGAGLSVLGVEARDPVWMMTIALLRCHYSYQRITISSLADASGTAYSTALRQIERMVCAGLLSRDRDPEEPKLVFIEPTETLLHNFHDYCAGLKQSIGKSFGLRHHKSEAVVFGGAHLAACIIGPPRKIAPALRLDGPLRLLLKDEPVFLTLKRMEAEISVFLNTDIEIELLAYDPLNQTIIENGRADRSSYDIVAVDVPWLGRMAMERSLLPLDGYLQRGKLNPFDFFAAAWSSAHSQGRQLGIPASPTAELLLYRKDIFEKHGIDPPETAQSVLSAARAMHRPARGKYGIAWNAGRGQPLGQTFIQTMAAFGSPPVNLRRFGTGYDNDTPWEELRPTLDHETGRAALDYLMDLATVSPPGIADMDWTGRTRCYRNGEVAMCYEWSTNTSQFEGDPASPASGNTGYLVHPGRQPGSGVSPMGGFVYAIPRNLPQDRQREIWRALEWLASPEVTKYLMLNGSPAKFLHSVSADPDVPEAAPAMRAMAAFERRNQLQTWPRPPIPFMASIMRIVGQEVHDAIWGTADAADVLSRAENRIRPLLDMLKEDHAPKHPS